MRTARVGSDAGLAPDPFGIGGIEPLHAFALGLQRVALPEALEHVATVYRDRCGWPVTVVDDAMDAPFGAPTAGPPPYAVFRIEPIRAYAIGITDETSYLSTRYQF